MSLWECPICKENLEKKEKQFVCKNNHQFDIAKQNYINLLMSQISKDKQHGDSKEMVLARSNFLEKGYYSVFRDTLESIVSEHEPTSVLDIGCGEGWYAENISVPNLYGIDISKEAIKLATRRLPQYQFAVASSYALPIVSNSIDLAYSIFAPFKIEEVHRVLREGGIFIEVFPLPKHLYDLKHILYDKPYLNPEYTTEYEGFELLEVKQVSDAIKIETSEDIHNLFMMTPYYHRTPESNKKRLAVFVEMNTDIGFGFAIFQKN